jgi:chemotaxis protein MotB
MSEAESIGNPGANDYERGAAQYADPFSGKRADDDVKRDESVDVLKLRRLDAQTPPGAAVHSQVIPSDPLRFELGRRIASDPMLRSIAEPMFEAKNGSTSISIVDSDVVSLFAVGSAVPTPKAVVLINAIGSVLVNKKNRIIIQGHTDSRPFRSDQHDKWRLSTERALVTYQILRRAGLAESRFLRVEGYADRNLRIADNPNSAENRRIQIIIVE